MFQSKSILVVLLLALSQIALAGVTHVTRANVEGRALKHRTNAARMAAGLAPLPPANFQKRTGFGGGHGGGHGGGGGGGWGTPTKPQPQQPAKPSPGPGKPDCDDKKEVKIKCKRKGGNSIGYISKDWSKKGKRGFGLCNNARDALPVDFENSVTPFDFKISKGGKDDFSYLGFTGNNLDSKSSAVLCGTKKTNKGNSPSNVGNSYSSWSANSESQIWHYSRSNKSVESKWVNQGGQTVQSSVCYEPSEDLFHLVTDVAAFKRRYPQSYEVEFELED